MDDKSKYNTNHDKQNYTSYKFKSLTEKYLIKVIHIFISQTIIRELSIKQFVYCYNL